MISPDIFWKRAITKMFFSEPSIAWDKRGGLRRRARRQKEYGTEYGAYNQVIFKAYFPALVESISNVGRLGILDTLAIENSLIGVKDLYNQLGYLQRYPPRPAEENIHRFKQSIREEWHDARVLFHSRWALRRQGHSQEWRAFYLADSYISNLAAFKIAQGVSLIDQPFAFAFKGNFLTFEAFAAINTAARNNVCLVHYEENENRSLYVFRDHAAAIMSGWDDNPDNTKGVKEAYSVEPEDPAFAVRAVYTPPPGAIIDMDAARVRLTKRKSRREKTPRP